MGCCSVCCMLNILLEMLLLIFVGLIVLWEEVGMVWWVRMRLWNLGVKCLICVVMSFVGLRLELLGMWMYVYSMDLFLGVCDGLSMVGCMVSM